MLAKIKTRIGKAKDLFVEHFKCTVIGMAINKSSPEEWDDFQKRSFEKAKLLSDFVGILMRAAFTFLLFKFFSHMAKTEDSWLLSTALGTNSFLCLVLYLFIIIRLFDTISSYWLKDTSYHSNRTIKITITIFSFIIVLSIAYGIGVLATTFASMSNLPH